jgi:hypothetical protein
LEQYPKSTAKNIVAIPTMAREPERYGLDLVRFFICNADEGSVMQTWFQKKNQSQARQEQAPVAAVSNRNKALRSGISEVESWQKEMHKRRN